MSRQCNHQPIGVWYKYQTLDWGVLRREEKAGTLGRKRRVGGNSGAHTRATCAVEGAQEGSFRNTQGIRASGKNPFAIHRRQFLTELRKRSVTHPGTEWTVTIVRHDQLWQFC